MTKSFRNCLIYIIGIALLTAAQFASAGIDRQARINFRSSSMIGECSFGIDELEPYEIINSDCETLKMTTGAPEQLAIRPLRAFDIGWPRTGYKEWYWNTPLFGAPDPDELYCQNRGTLKLATITPRLI